VIDGNCNLQYLKSKMFTKIKVLTAASTKKQSAILETLSKAIWEVYIRTKVAAVPKLEFLKSKT